MKKIILAIISLSFCLSSMAQTSEKKSLPQKVGATAGVAAYQVEKGAKKVGKATTKGAKAVGKVAVSGYNEVGKAFGYYDPLTINDDLVKVKGAYYMRIYDTNLYHEPEGQMFRDECRRQFELENPGSVIISVVIPQNAWFTSPVVKGGQHEGDVQFLYCYVTAFQRGTYINARFSYKRYSDNGKTYQPLPSNWPKWERTDRMTRAVFGKL